MTLILAELNDEPLGKHPFQAAACAGPCTFCGLDETEQEVGAATVYHSSTFHVDGLGDEALDPPKSRPVLITFVGCVKYCIKG